MKIYTKQQTNNNISLVDYYEVPQVKAREIK